MSLIHPECVQYLARAFSYREFSQITLRHSRTGRWYFLVYQYIALESSFQHRKFSATWGNNVHLDTICLLS